MDYISHAIHAILHLDQSLQNLVLIAGNWTYLILFLIVFCETGLVVTPFLPGDSLIFATGVTTQVTHLSLTIVTIVFLTAAILGNLTNYLIGRWCGPKIFDNQQSKWLNPDHLRQGHAFYEKYGAIAIVLARFMPIIRTIVPFVAGISYMDSKKYTLYTILGAILWIGSLLLLSVGFGQLPIVKQHFSLIVVGIVIISMIPLFLALILKRTKSQ